MGSKRRRPWLLAALAALELELLSRPVPRPRETEPAWPPWRAICCCCRRIWSSEEVRPSDVSGIEVATDIWFRPDTCSYSDTIVEKPINPDVTELWGKWFMMFTHCGLVGSVSGFSVWSSGGGGRKPRCGPL